MFIACVNKVRMFSYDPRITIIRGGQGASQLKSLIIIKFPWGLNQMDLLEPPPPLVLHMHELERTLVLFMHWYCTCHIFLSVSIFTNQALLVLCFIFVIVVC